MRGLYWFLPESIPKDAVNSQVKVNRRISLIYSPVMEGETNKFTFSIKAKVFTFLYSVYLILK